MGSACDAAAIHREASAESQAQRIVGVAIHYGEACTRIPDGRPVALSPVPFGNIKHSCMVGWPEPPGDRKQRTSGSRSQPARLQRPAFAR
jgi:hypothetical protein